MFLTFFLLLPLSFIFTISFLKKETHIKIISFILSVFHLLTGCILFFKFNKSESGTHQFIESVNLFKPLGVHYAVGVDGLSLFLSMLTVLILPFVVLVTWSKITKNLKFYHIGFFVFQICTIGAYLSMDMILFSLFFEAGFLCFLFLMGLSANKEKLNFKNNKFMILNFFGSVLFIGAVTTMGVLYESVHGATNFLMSELLRIDLPFVKGTIFSTQTVLSMCFLFGLMVKSIGFLFHKILLEHTKGLPSGLFVVSECLFLNIGIYGVVRFFPLYFPQVASQYSDFLSALVVVGLIFGLIKIIMQKTLRIAVVYFSFIQACHIVLGVFYLSAFDGEKVAIQLVFQSLIISGLFFIADVFEKKFKEENIQSPLKLIKKTPLASFSFMGLLLVTFFIPFIIEMKAFEGDSRYCVFILLCNLVSVFCVLKALKFSFKKEF